MRLLLVVPFLLAATASFAADRPFLGVSTRALTEEEKKTTGLAAGVVIDKVISGGGADKAGLKPGDVISGIGGTAISAPEDVRAAALLLKIGEETEVSFVRSGKEQKANLTPVSFEKWNSMVGTAAPALDFRDFAGEKFAWADLKGKVLVLSFFQITCPGCRESHPRIEELAKEFGAKGVEVVGVHTAFEDFGDQTDEKVKAYVQEQKFGYRVGIAKSEKDKAPAAMDDYRTGGTPCICVVDRKGVIRFKAFGEFDQDKLKALLDDLLKEPAEKKD